MLKQRIAKPERELRLGQKRFKVVLKGYKPTPKDKADKNLTLFIIDI